MDYRAFRQTAFFLRLASTASPIEAVVEIAGSVSLADTAAVTIKIRRAGNHEGKIAIRGLDQKIIDAIAVQVADSFGKPVDATRPLLLVDRSISRPASARPKTWMPE